MAKRGVGSKKNTLPIMIGGLLSGVVLDAVYASLGGPGGSEEIPQCNMLTVGDAFQLGGAGALTTFAILVNSTQLAAFTSGILLGGLLPKVVFPAFNLPRYGVFDFDPKSGQISPIGRFETPTEGSASEEEEIPAPAPAPGPNIGGKPMPIVGGEPPPASSSRVRRWY